MSIKLVAIGSVIELSDSKFKPLAHLTHSNRFNRMGTIRTLIDITEERINILSTHGTEKHDTKRSAEKRLDHPNKPENESEKSYGCVLGELGIS